MSNPASAHPNPGDDGKSPIQFDADLFDLLPDAVLALDSHGRIVARNRAAVDLLNGTDPTGKRLDDVLTNLKPPTETLRAALAGEPVAPVEVTLSPGIVVEAQFRRSGSTLLVLLRDVSAVRPLEAALRESEERFKNLAENISEIYWLRDANTGETLYISPAHEAIYGHSLANAYADRWSFLDAIHPDDRALFANGGQTKKNPYFEAEYRITQPDGSLRWAAARTFPIYNEAGDVYRLGGVITDITERKQIDLERTRRLSQLQALADAAFRINASTGIDEILNIITNELQGIIGTHQALTILTPNGREPLRSAMSLSEKYAEWRDYKAPPTHRDIYTLMAEEKRVIRFTQAEVQAQARFSHFRSEAGRPLPLTGGWMAAPIQAEDGEVLGLLQLSDKINGDFTEEDEVLLSQIAQLAAISLTKARLFEAERRARMIADTLQSANAAINQTLALQPILELLLDYLGRLVPYDGANVMLLEDDGRFRARAAKGYADWGLQEPPGWILDPAQHALIGRLVKTRQPVKIDDTEQEADWYTHPDTPQIRSWLGVPLIAENTMIGIYSLDSVSADAFTFEHVQIAGALAAPAAFAIQKALLFDQVQHYAAELEQRVEERTRELVEANQQLEAMNLAKAKFVSDVSHELRNPIASLSLSFELMRRRSNEQIIERLPDMKEPIDLLLKLTNKILDISRLDLARGKPVTFTAVDLGTLVSQVVEAYRPEAETAGLSLNLSVEPQLPPVRGEPSQLAQVATNLISNAIKYTPSGHIDVSLRLDSVSGMVALAVQDTGLGIEDEDMPHLLDRFYRGNKVRQSTIPGTGLGLPIVHDVVQIHSGTIRIESKPGVGSCFTVFLPLSGPGSRGV